MASNSILQELFQLLNGNVSPAESEGRISVLRAEYEEVVGLKAKNAAASATVPSLTICQFSKLQFPNSEEWRCSDYFPVR